MKFSILKEDRSTQARLGKIETERYTSKTPVFMPVGTLGTVKALSPGELKDMGATIILGNTYHLYLRPGVKLIETLGGLHRFASWNRLILTDSGGFQVHSLNPLRKITENGVEFRSHLDGSKHFFTPEKVIEIQRILGSDFVMPLDWCVSYPATEADVEKGVELTIRWAKRSKAVLLKEHQSLFAILQGGMSERYRRQCAEELVGMGFEGYAIGGLSVGEPKSLMWEMVELSTSLLPKDKPRYLMGVGKPEDIVFSVMCGVDMFDCVLPTRCARNGLLFTSKGKLRIKNSIYKNQDFPVDEDCNCYTCRNFSRAYLRHLFVNDEILALRLNTIHNVYFYLSLMEEVRTRIADGNFERWAIRFIKEYPEMEA